MRIVISSTARIDVPEQYSDAVDAILNQVKSPGLAAGQLLRQTYQGQQGTNEQYFTRLVSYPSPDTGQTMYAVDDVDPAVREVEETPDLAEAEARYEEVVRDRVAAQHDPEPYDYSDVPGVPAHETP